MLHDSAAHGFAHGRRRKLRTIHDAETNIAGATRSCGFEEALVRGWTCRSSTMRAPTNHQCAIGKSTRFDGCLASGQRFSRPERAKFRPRNVCKSLQPKPKPKPGEEGAIQACHCLQGQDDPTTCPQTTYSFRCFGEAHVDH